MEHLPRRVPGPQPDILDFLLPALEEMPIIGDIIEVITGIGRTLGDLGDWVAGLLGVDSVNDLIAIALGLIADLLDNVPLVGDSLAEIVQNIADSMNDTHSTASTAQTTASQAAGSVVSLQTTIFSVASTRPLWDGPDPTGESTFPFYMLGGGIHSHGATLDVTGLSTAGGGSQSCSATAHSHGTHTQ
ncbi:hypothetical protein, partial [Nocardia sp. NPDC057455]|uniref:hypothetical protein n=1 Tax=Nocardia sp. NPDC057455 TaxID=3346138 RepID=UPI00366BEA09